MRFVIQRHTNHNDHYDLMIEQENSPDLLTWMISEESLKELLNGSQAEAKSLPDHRKEYLTYEGIISGNRGRVKIFDSGICKLLLASKDTIKINIVGRIFNGIICIQKIKKDYFIIKYSPGEVTDGN